jgi:hypothetical protein
MPNVARDALADFDNLIELGGSSGIPRTESGVA